MLLLLLALVLPAAAGLQMQCAPHTPAISLVQRLADPGRLVDTLIPRIAIVRPPESAGHARVRRLALRHFADLGWDCEEHADRVQTAHGTKMLHNLVFMHGSTASTRSRLVLAAHYDSKTFPAATFVGAIDAAVSVAVLMEVARVYTAILDGCVAECASDWRQLQIVLFDGEEAFEEWSSEDSIYGARTLHAKWAGAPGALQSISLMVLLDLLGSATPFPQIHNYFPDNSASSERGWAVMRDIDAALVHGGSQNASVFEPAPWRYAAQGAVIEDDHVPFLRSDVPVVHAIPYPFPRCWHEPCDDLAQVDAGMVARWVHIVAVFALHHTGIKLHEQMEKGCGTV